MKQELIEEWKPIEGYEGYYEVSNFGRVRSVGRVIYRKNGIKQTFKKRILKEALSGKYYVVTLLKNGVQKTHYIHVLVATAFIDGRNECVNHKDGNKLNNHVSNLEWCTNSENMSHAYRHGLKKAKPRFGKDNATSKRVIQSKGGVDIKVWDSMMDADRAGFSMKCISNCCAHRSNSHKGYQWRYAE